MLDRLKNGLAPVTVVRGPRQVGKSTLQDQITDHLLHREQVPPSRIFRVQFDDLTSVRGLGLDPILNLAFWYEEHILGSSFNAQARKNEPAFVIFDEVQNVPNWAPQIKSLVDHNSIRVLLTGSSAFQIERGRESLAGRVSTLEMGTLLLREISELRGWGAIPPALPLNGLGPLKEQDFWKQVKEHGGRYREPRLNAFATFSERGGYPIAQSRPDRPWEEIADQLNETVIRRVIRHDLRESSERGRRRDEALLEEAFRVCCRYAGQSPGQVIFTQELQAALAADVGWQRIRAYTRFLGDTLLMRLVPPLELRLKRQKGQPKICLCDHALRASWLQETIPLTSEGLQAAPHLSDLAGHLAESVAGYFLTGIPGLDLAWFPERPAEPEVDFVLTIGERRIPLEVKYRRHIDPFRDTFGLRAFMEKTAYNAPFGILVTLEEHVDIPDPRVVALPLSSLLLLR
ncbi:MAG: AAA family ATPase [Chloroflexi bacterium]|nr:AAA family ATPase [Chloroflexota bacterium]